MIAPICLCKLSSNPPNLIPQMRISSAQNISHSQCTQSQSQSQTVNTFDLFPQRISSAANRGNTTTNSDDAFQFGSSQHTDQHSTAMAAVEPSVSLLGSSPILLESEQNAEYSTR